ncbi:28S ribosomal protein S23, mitochondrial [Bombina bombina]|uniref:28S ribosomal protein S23, mitochondrial n=1 Tax=Bombina bombina TaxID=8345 RepID=UPI00235AD7F9|nr:28S ribosomal protein S23, mitochondrial [Bombina bombina]
MGSLTEKISQVRDLLRAGVIKQNEKPVWYDVYAAFPPKREPLYEIPVWRSLKSPDNIPEILYKEDAIRAKFYKAYGSGPRAFDLSRSNFKSTCQRFVEKYTELQKTGEINDEELFDETGKALLTEGIILRRKGAPWIRPSKSTETETRDPLLEMNLKNMLEEMQQQQQEGNSSEAEKSSP